MKTLQDQICEDCAEDFTPLEGCQFVCDECQDEADILDDEDFGDFDCSMNY